MILHSHSLVETRNFGKKIGLLAKASEVYGFIGDLGCGKTEFIRGFVSAFNDSVIVKSPSFSLVNTYETSLFPLFHFDFYRLVKAAELDEIGFSEYLSMGGICLVEWADMFPSVMPQSTKIIRLRGGESDDRTIEYDF